MVRNCSKCVETRVKRAEPMLVTETPKEPWELIVIDLFHFDAGYYVLIVDYRSHFPEVLSLRSTRTSAVISAIKSVFTRYSIPKEVQSDNGQQFAAKEFANFCRTYSFHQITSGPGFSQSDGEVECMVRTLKDLLKKTEDPHLTLLLYQDTPLLRIRWLDNSRFQGTDNPRSARKTKPSQFCDALSSAL